MKNVLRVFLLLTAGLAWAGGSYAQEEGLLTELTPATRQVLETRCTSCYGRDEESVSVFYSRLVGQHSSWLVTQLEDFGRRERIHDNAVKHSIASKLTGLEIHAVAAYLAGQQ